jgi:hypothetical protein
MCENKNYYKKKQKEKNSVDICRVRQESKQKQGTKVKPKTGEVYNDLR